MAQLRLNRIIIDSSIFISPLPIQIQLATCMPIHLNSCIYISLSLSFVVFVLNITKMCVNSKLRDIDREKDYDCFGDYDFDTVGIGRDDRCSYKELEEVEKVSDCECVMQLNCRGLKSKISKLEYLLNNDLIQLNVKVVMLIETWLKPGEEKYVKVKGYNFVGQPRPSRKGGGVGLLIREDIKYRVISQKSEPEFENILVELKNANKELIGATYRPPNTDPQKFIAAYDALTHRHKNRMLTIGTDHNMDLIKCDKHDPTQTYLELNFDRGLVPTITKPTRVTHTSATLIDNIFCSLDMLNYYETQIILTDISDHFPCLLLRGSDEATINRPIRKRQLNGKTIAKIKRDLEQKSLDNTDRQCQL